MLLYVAFVVDATAYIRALQVEQVATGFDLISEFPERQQQKRGPVVP